MHYNVLTAGSRYHVEDVGCVSIEHSEVFEVVSSLDHQDYVDTNDKVEGAQERLVVLPVAEVEVMGQLLRDGLVPSLGCRGLRRNQPATWRYFSVSQSGALSLVGIVQAWLSLVESFTELTYFRNVATPALLCPKDY